MGPSSLEFVHVATEYAVPKWSEFDLTVVLKNAESADLTDRACAGTTPKWPTWSSETADFPERIPLLILEATDAMAVTFHRDRQDLCLPTSSSSLTSVLVDLPRLRDSVPAVLLRLLAEFGRVKETRRTFVDENPTNSEHRGDEVAPEARVEASRLEVPLQRRGMSAASLPQRWSSSSSSGGGAAE